MKNKHLAKRGSGWAEIPWRLCVAVASMLGHRGPQLQRVQAAEQGPSAEENPLLVIPGRTAAAAGLPGTPRPDPLT